MRISPAAQILELRRNLWHGVPARSTFKATRPACTSKFPPRRCGRAMVHVCVEIWGAAGPNPLSWPDSIGNILTPPRLPRFRCGAQCKMQWLEKPSMAYQTCFACANASQPDWHQHRRTPCALGDVTDCPNLAIKNMQRSLGHSEMSLTVLRPGQRCPNFLMQSP